MHYVRISTTCKFTQQGHNNTYNQVHLHNYRANSISVTEPYTIYQSKLLNKYQIYIYIVNN